MPLDTHGTQWPHHDEYPAVGTVNREQEVRVPDRTDIRVLIALGAIALIAGVVLVALASGTVLMVIGIALLGLSAIAFVSLAFLLVGQSEERDRQRHPRG